MPKRATLARLSTIVVLAPLLLAGTGRLVKRDHENYTKGRFLAYAAPWSTATLTALKQGADYDDHLTIDPAAFPAGTRLDWRWPRTPAPTGVYGYMHVSYGNYNNGVPERAVRPVQVSRIAALSTDYALSYGARDGDFNVLAELFATTAPRKADTKVLEIGFFPRVSQSGQAFFDRSRQLGNWTDPQGVEWRVAIAKTYCMFVPTGGERASGTIDFKAALAWLVERRELSGREWVNGVAIGVEPVSGGGSMTLDRWTVRFR